MVAPVAAWRDRLTERFPMVSTLPFTGLLFLIALVLAPALLVSAAMLAGRALAHVAKPGRELFCRFSLALLAGRFGDVGSASALSPVHLPGALRGRLCSGLRATWVSVGSVRRAGRRRVRSSLRIPCSPIQMLLLDAGLLLSFYVGWRIARGLYEPPSGWPTAARSLGNRRGSALCRRRLGVPSADANARDGSRVKTRDPAAECHARSLRARACRRRRGPTARGIRAVRRDGFCSAGNAPGRSDRHECFGSGPRDGPVILDTTVRSRTFQPVGDAIPGS